MPLILGQEPNHASLHTPGRRPNAAERALLSKREVFRLSRRRQFVCIGRRQAVLGSPLQLVMRSPYASDPCGTPIASAKRPRPNNSAVKLDYNLSGGDEAEKENETGFASPKGKGAGKPSFDREGQPGGYEEGDVEKAPGKWSGHLGALFSPVLRFLGGDGEGGDDDSINREDGQALSEEAIGGFVAQGGEAGEAPQEAEQSPSARSLSSNGSSSSASQVVEEAEEDDESEYDEFNPYLFMKQLPPYDEVAFNVKPHLPPRRMTRGAPKVTLVLDLDETLVHCSVEPSAAADLVFPVQFNGMEYQVHVQKRPHLEFFLQQVAKHFEVVVFTASQQVYADKLLDIIDPNHELIKHRLFRDSCLLVEGNYLKDLHVLGRDMSQMVLVDNSPHAFGYQVDNGIPILSWFDDPEDGELLNLLTFLEQIQDVDDVRPIVRKHFKTYQLINDAQ